MTNSSIVLSFGEFFKAARLKNQQVCEADVFRDFACENDLTLQEVSMLVNERPQLGRLKFLAVSEVVLQQVTESGSRGRPVIYGEFYAILQSLLRMVREAGYKHSFKEIYELTILKAMEKNAEVKVPAYSTAYTTATTKGWR